MWIILLSAIAITAVFSLGYIAAHIRRFAFIQRISENHKILSWMAAFCFILPLGFFALINVTTMLVVLVHLAIGFALCDFVFFIVRKTAKKNVGPTVCNVCAILLTVVYLGVGWIMAHHVFVTHYTVHTDKEIGGNLRIIQIADSHIGITLDGEGFARQMERVKEYNPDVVVITGDFVDDDTCYEDMERACRALGSIDTEYGVFFVFGNHDKGYYNSRDFSTDQLRRALEENGVIILEDESNLVNDSFYIIGRKDRSDRSRQDMAGLVSGFDSSKYYIVLDHQPNDYDNEEASGVDLVLSGHTHGGHLFPLALVGLLSGANDREYGIEERGKTTFIVTSGISGWAIPFKTGCFSEFVIIDIAQGS